MASIFKGVGKIAKPLLDPLGITDMGLKAIGMDLDGGGGFEGAKADLVPQAINQPPATMPVQGTVAEKRSQRRKAAAEVRRRRGRSSTILTALDGDEGTLG